MPPPPPVALVACLSFSEDSLPLVFFFLSLSIFSGVAAAIRRGGMDTRPCPPPPHPCGMACGYIAVR